MQMSTTQAFSISTALVVKLLVIEQLLHPALKSTVSAPWHNFHLCPFSQQILATPLTETHTVEIYGNAMACKYESSSVTKKGADCQMH